ncbi:MAG: threonine synthase [Candidatus Hadarchaeales archaeon]
MRLECFECHAKFDVDERIYECPKCGGLLEVEFTKEELRKNLKKYPMSGDLRVWRYRAFLPIIDDSKIVSIGEGGTPLIKCVRLARELGIEEFYLKFEGANPTGSFKDRGMTVGVTKALEFGVKTVACASTGNTSASLAAYAARAGLKCLVLLPKGKVALGKLTQTLVHGAQVVAVRGNFDEALDILRQLCAERKDIYLLNSINPFRPQGQKTIGFEIVEQLGMSVPDRVIVPMGNCANIWAIYKGFVEFKMAGLIKKIPKMTGIQAEGAKPIVDAFKKNLKKFVPVKNPETIATAIRIGNPVNGPKALHAIRASGGTAEAVSDAEIVEAQKMVARLEGIGIEPASAASVAGLKKLLEAEEINKDEMIVCVATGHVLKDPEEAIEISAKPMEAPVSRKAIEELIG